MRRAPILTTTLLAVAGAVMFTGAASAQTAGPAPGEARGLRYLTWSGRGDVAPPAPTTAAAVPGRPDLRRPNPVIPHGGFASAAPASLRSSLTPAPGARRTLTPAHTWLQPPTPTPEATIAEPAMVPPAAPRLASPPLSPAPQPRPAPEYLPDPGGRGQAVPAEMIYAAPQASATTAPYDPMAPRRDAPIFRMQQDAPSAAPTPATPAAQTAEAAPEGTPRPRRVAEVSNSLERPPAQGGRYYSVHRQNGRQPDALDMPAPTYVDGLVVTMPETIASQDLAVPEQGPTLIRDTQGRVRRAPAASDGDHQ